MHAMPQVLRPDRTARCEDLSLSLAAPDAVIARTPGIVWVAWGVNAQDVESLRRPARSPGSPEAELCNRRGDAAIVKVHLQDERPVAVEAWKGLTSCHEVFHARTAAGGLLIADHFRNIVAGLPPGQRGTAPEALIEHFLFRTIPAPRTMCAAIGRLGRGEKLTCDVVAGTTGLAQFERAGNTAVAATAQAYAGRVDAALTQAMEETAGSDGTAALFSGGVDSTLLHAYLGRETAAVHYTLPDYEREFERSYAEDAARLLGISLHTHAVSEADYVERLERAIDLTGLPAPHLQFANFVPLFGLDFRRFVVGEQGDALFGISVKQARAAAPFASPPGIAMLQAATALMPRRSRERWSVLAASARTLSVPADAPWSYANRMGVYIDEPLVRRMFDGATLDERILARRDGLARRVDFTVPPSRRLQRQIEMAQLLDYMTEEMVTCFRHLAHGLGRSVVAPFLDRRVFDAAMSVPAAERYVRGLQGKYLLKAVLARRVPGYPVDQRKGRMGISFRRYCLQGPLADIWERYAIPDLVAPELRARLTGEPSPTTWNAVTLAIWDQRIRRNEALRPLPGTRRLDWSSDAVARSARA